MGSRTAGAELRIPIFAALLLASAAGTNARGQTDVIGAYFDDAAISECVLGSIGTLVTVHVIYSSPSVAEIAGYDFGITLTQYQATPPVVVAITATGADEITDIGQVSVRYAEPLACGARATLCSVQVLWLGGVSRFYVTGAAAPSLPMAGPFVVLGSGEGLGLSPRAWGAAIDGGYEVCEGLPVEATGWGAVKALYRP